jgi:glutathione S-transferase
VSQETVARPFQVILLKQSFSLKRYLCDTYDTSHRLLPAVGDPKRYAVLQWVHAAEATFALHSISVMYARWHQKSGDPKETEIGLSKNIQNDLDFLNAELEKSKGKFLFGDELTVADIQMHFSVAFILARELGTLGKRWERCEKFVKDCEATESYKKAVEKTGHSF